MYEIRNEICIPDSTSYFMKDLDRIFTADYVPSMKDILMVRKRTSGITKQRIELDENLCTSLVL